MAIQADSTMATLRENPAKAVKLLVGPTFVKSHDQLNSKERAKASGILRRSQSPPMCRAKQLESDTFQTHTPPGIRG